MNHCYIYRIKHSPTGRCYIGSSLTFPTSRWSQHISMLRNGNHHGLLFQKAWDENQNITQWEFCILSCVKRMLPAPLKRLEAEHILALPKELRLNMPNTLTLTTERNAEIERRLIRGDRYVDIRDDIGVSMGTISAIKQRMPRNMAA